jgi:hypothetical protein
MHMKQRDGNDGYEEGVEDWLCIIKLPEQQ